MKGTRREREMESHEHDDEGIRKRLHDPLSHLTRSFVSREVSSVPSEAPHVRKTRRRDVAGLSPLVANRPGPSASPPSLATLLPPGRRACRRRNERVWTGLRRASGGTGPGSLGSSVPSSPRSPSCPCRYTPSATR